MTSFYSNKARHDGLSVYCKTCHIDVTLTERRTKRNQALDILGPRCVQCGFDADRRGLAFDHINGDGHIDRKSIGWGSGRLYRQVIAGERDDIQVLCFTCNQIKKLEREEIGARRVATVEENFDHDPAPPPDGRFEGIGNRWSRDHDQCLDCQRNDRRHGAFGYCATCYVRPKNQVAIEQLKWTDETKRGKPRGRPGPKVA